MSGANNKKTPATLTTTHEGSTIQSVSTHTTSMHTTHPTNVVTSPTLSQNAHPASTVVMDEGLRKELQQDLIKTEEDIQALRSVLNSKLRHLEEIKAKLGISPIQEIKDDINQGIKNLKESTAYKKSSEVVHDLQETLSENPLFQKTSETVKKAGETINETLNPLLSSVKSKFTDIKNSKVYKSFEDTVGDAYCSVKGKIGAVPGTPATIPESGLIAGEHTADSGSLLTNTTTK